MQSRSTGLFGVRRSVWLWYVVDGLLFCVTAMLVRPLVQNATELRSIKPGGLFHGTPDEFFSILLAFAGLEMFLAIWTQIRCFPIVLTADQIRLKRENTETERRALLRKSTMTSLPGVIALFLIVPYLWCPLLHNRKHMESFYMYSVFEGLGAVLGLFSLTTVFGLIEYNCRFPARKVVLFIRSFGLGVVITVALLVLTVMTITDFGYTFTFPLSIGLIVFGVWAVPRSWTRACQACCKLWADGSEARVS